MTTLVLIGPHGAGKTTLGHRLSELLGWPFHDEIGRRLLAEPDAGEDATCRGLDFDARVLALELERDRTAPPHRIVESWHVQNLAYAERRNPDWARRVMPVVRAAISRSEVLVLPLTASPSDLRLRLSEPGDPATLLPFFAEVAARAEALARDFGLLVLPAWDTSRPENVMPRRPRALPELGFL